MILFVDKGPSVRICSITKILNVILSDYPNPVRKASVIDTVNELETLGILETRRIPIIPERLSNDKKLNGYETAIHKNYGEDPETANRFLDMVRENSREQQNFSDGKFERYVWISKGLSPGFVARKKNEVANFFGFRNWYSGIVKTDGTKSTYQRIRKSYPQLVRSRIRHHAFREVIRERNILDKGVVQTGLNRFQRPNEGSGRGTVDSSANRPDT